MDPGLDTEWEGRLRRAAALWRSCTACEHRCGVDRFVGERGICAAGALPSVCNEVLQLGEEIDLVPTYMVLLAGCDLRCRHCSEGSAVEEPTRGRPLHADAERALAQRIRAAASPGRSSRARFVTFVGGEVTIHLEPLLRLLRRLDGSPPAVLVSNLHATPDALALLLEPIHALVADLKFGPDARCALDVADATNYWSVVTRNLEAAAALRPLYIRHLVMPGHVECCTKPVLSRAGQLAARYRHVRVNLMSTYRPLHRAAMDPVLCHPPSPDEQRASLAAARVAVPAAALLVDGLAATRA